MHALPPKKNQKAVIIGCILAVIVAALAVFMLVYMTETPPHAVALASQANSAWLHMNAASVPQASHVALSAAHGVLQHDLYIHHVHHVHHVHHLNHVALS